MTALAADRDQIGRHFNALFPHAREGGTVSLRAFYDDELARKGDEKPFKIRSIRLNGGGLEPVADAAFKLATDAAEATRPVVLAPPIATFNGSKADAKSQLEGLVLSVELDVNPTASLAKLRAILGPPTLVVASGGEWVDADGVVHPKLHAHWRLKEPTQTPEEHQLLNQARDRACDFVGADATSKNAVHPMRLAGTLHRKNLDRPRLATIVEENPDSEISLDDALSELEGLKALREAAGEGGEKTPTNGDGQHDPTGNDGLILACAERMPNPDLDWAAWNRLGMACWRASGGSEAGRRAFHVISEKSGKYDPAATDARYDHYRTSPPDKLSVATLVYEARKGDPQFLKKKAKANTDQPSAARSVGREQEHDPESALWQDDLHRTDRGEARDVMHNVAIILRKDTRLVRRLRWNETMEAVEGVALPWRKGGSWQAWTDADDIQLANWCQQRHVYVTPRRCADAVQLVARDRPHHPVRELLDSLVWDGTPRLGTWLSTYLGVADTPYSRAVGFAWPVSAVARIYRPGCKADHALILEGMQGALKSTTACTLATDDAWFADEIADLGGKDSAQDLRGKWIIELAELSALKRGEVERVKAFMSRRIDHYRPSYGVRSQDFPRQCVFIGSTNADSYLVDETGNRRFWPVKVGRIDIEALRRDVRQLWAEAVVAFKAGEQWWLPKELEETAREEQETRRIDDPWERYVLEYLVGSAETSVHEVLEHAINMSKDRHDQTARRRVGGSVRSRATASG